MSLVVELRGVIPAAKGNSKKIFKAGNRLVVASNDKDRAREQNLVALLYHHPARPAAPLEGALRVDVVALVAVPASWSQKRRAAALSGELRPTTRPDRGNYLKLAEDALQEAGYLRDDSAIVEGDVVKRYSDPPGWRFEISPVTTT